MTIDSGAGSLESIPRVATGPYDMGFGDINSLIRFRDQNPEVGVKAVMMVYNRPPFAIVGRASRGISEDIESLRGKRFGRPGPRCRLRAMADLQRRQRYRCGRMGDDLRKRRLPGA